MKIIPRQAAGITFMIAGIVLAGKLGLAWIHMGSAEVVPSWEFWLLGIPASFFLMAFGLLFEKPEDESSFDFLTPEHRVRVKSFGRAVNDGHVHRARMGQLDRDPKYGTIIDAEYKVR